MSRASQRYQRASDSDDEDADFKQEDLGWSTLHFTGQELAGRIRILEKGGQNPEMYLPTVRPFHATATSAQAI
jgi:hypothetical protein